jgi:hypothetical protein
LRDLYRSIENPGEHPLKAAQAKLDEAVRAAYGIAEDADPLAFLLNLNAELAEAEAAGKEIRGPGLPDFVNDRASFVTTDCVTE